MDKPVNPMRADEDPTVMEAFAEGRAADDIWVIDCSCGWWSYWNEGSHANCRNCGLDLTCEVQAGDAITILDYWEGVPYSCDDRV